MKLQVPPFLFPLLREIPCQGAGKDGLGTVATLNSKGVALHFQSHPTCCLQGEIGVPEEV